MVLAFRKSSRSHRFQSTSVPVLRSEEHTSELQSRSDLVCRLLLEKKKKAAIDEHVTERGGLVSAAVLRSVGAIRHSLGRSDEGAVSEVVGGVVMMRAVVWPSLRVR